MSLNLTFEIESFIVILNYELRSPSLKLFLLKMIIGRELQESFSRILEHSVIPTQELNQ